MGINVTYKSSTGEETKGVVEGEGTIDTPEEAALASISRPDEKATVTTESGETFDQAALMAIINGKTSQPEAAPASEAPKETAIYARADRSFNAVAEGGYSQGSGDYGHKGATARIGVNAQKNVQGDFFVTGGIGANYRSGKLNFLTPGGEDVSSSFSAFGVDVTVGGLWSPKKLPQLTVGAGVRASAGALKTGENTYETLLDGSRSNTGLSGLKNDDTGSARAGQGGALLTVGLPISAGYEFPVGSTTVGLTGTVIPTLNSANPNKGSGGTWASVDVLVGASVSFGGSSGGGSLKKIGKANAEGVLIDETVDASTVELTPELNEAGKTTITLDEAKVRELAGLKPSDVITGISIDGGPEQTLPATLELEPGKHTLGVNYNDGIDGKKHHRDVTILVGPLKAGIDDAGNIIGTSLLSGVNPNKQVNLPTAPAAGVAKITKSDEKYNVNLGSFTPVKNIPAGVTVSVRVGDKTVYEDTTPLKGNEAYSIVMPGFDNIGNNWVARDYATPGTKEKVQLVFKTVKGAEIATLDWPSYTVAPAIATLTEAAVISTPKKGQYYRNGETIRVRVVSDKDTKALATMIGEKYKQALTLKKGENFFDVAVTQVNGFSTKSKNELAVYVQPTNDAGAVEGVKVRAMPHTFVQKGAVRGGGSGRGKVPTLGR